MTDLSRRTLFGFIAAMPLAAKMAVTAPALGFFEDVVDVGEAYRYRQYSLGYMVTREVLEDDLYAMVTADIAQRMAIAQEAVAVDIMTNGFNAGDFPNWSAP